MTKRLVLLVVGCVTAFAATSMRRVARVQSGPYTGSYGRVVCCDSDHDSLPELIFRTGTIHPTDPTRVEVWEHQGWNRFCLVFADSGEYPRPPGITTGNAIPFAAGDIDDDGLTDIVCITIEPDFVDPEKAYDDVITIESPDSFSYPCSLSWYFRYDSNAVIPDPVYYTPDLDGDGHREIIKGIGGLIWENRGNNQNQLVWRGFGFGYTFGDFDMDGKVNFASASLNSNGIMVVWECSGDDQYQTVYRDTVWQPNGADVFMTRDIDGDSLPEFYVAYENVPRGMLYLYMWEMIGDNQYRRTLVDSLWFGGENLGRISECGDIDADGVDECIWTTPTEICVYKAVGDDSLQRVWNWYSDHGLMKSLVSTVYDINGDGYNELITAGNGKTSIFEIDAIDLASPNRGTFLPGDTMSIRWVTHSPPRCDSLSLLLRCDSLWNLDTIAHGLPATDTLHQWVIPASVPDTGRVVVIAYGPGWQFDISDSAISFTGGGVAEGPRTVPSQWSLSVSPNPARGAFSVRYDMPLTLALSRREREGEREAMSLGIYDVGGRLVRSLQDGDVAPGCYEARLPSGALPAGVYFCTLRAEGKRFSRKFILTE